MKTISLDRAVEVRDIVAALRKRGLTQTSLATATGASARSVRNWQRISAIRPQYEERLRELREIALILEETLTSRGVGQWLRARNRILGGSRPIDLLAAGNAEVVRQAAESYVEGAYV